SYSATFVTAAPRSPRPTPFPYTTLFRSARNERDLDRAGIDDDARPHVGQDPAPHRSLVAEAAVGDRLDRAGDGQGAALAGDPRRSEEHTSELQSLASLVCRLLLEKQTKS